jgi:hypothetical protein
MVVPLVLLAYFVSVELTLTLMPSAPFSTIFVTSAHSFAAIVSVAAAEIATADVT